MVLATDASVTPSGAVSIGVDADSDPTTPDVTVVQVPTAAADGTYNDTEIAGITAVTFVTHCELPTRIERVRMVLPATPTT